MVTKLGSINNYHKNFRFPSKNLHSSDDVIRFCWWRHQNRRFWRIFRSSGKNCVVTWVFVAWSWLTPHFKARRLLYNIQLQWLASLTVESHFKAVLKPIIFKIRLKSDKIRQIAVIWRHVVGFSQKLQEMFILLISWLCPNMKCLAPLERKIWQVYHFWL